MNRIKICPTCQLREKKPGSGYCRECYNKRARDRYKKQRQDAGLLVVSAEDRDLMRTYEPTVSEAPTSDRDLLIREGAELAKDWSKQDEWSEHQLKAVEAWTESEFQRKYKDA